MVRNLFLCLPLLLVPTANAQSLAARMDSLRTARALPRLAFIVISGDSVYALQVLGADAKGVPGSVNDRFHLGSNTKALTAVLAELLVAEGKITLATPFLDLFPELRNGARKEYSDLTLQDLLTFRGRVPAYTYTDERPRVKDITGDPAEQRLQVMRYALKQPPAEAVGGTTVSNMDYVMAGAMLERASGRTYVELLQGLGERFDMDLRTGPVDPTVVAPEVRTKMDWLESAGNVSTDLPGYARFLQQIINGWQMRGFLLPPEAYQRLVQGTPVFAEGWFHTDGRGADAEALTTIWGEGRFGLEAGRTSEPFAFNQGSAAGFSSQVRFLPYRNRAYAVFTDRSSPEVSRTLDAAMQLLLDTYR